MKGTMFKSVVGVLFILLAAGVLNPYEAVAQNGTSPSGPPNPPGPPNGTYPSGLSLGYYNQTCPQVNMVVQEMAMNATSLVRETAPRLLRMHFHDCFVNGCDGSVLIYSANHTAEMDAIPNKDSLQGYDFINSVKAKLEIECPGIVSCADIIALSALYSVMALAGFNGPPNYYWPVPLGRGDGIISSALEALENLPAPFFTYDELVESFATKGLNETQMVTLSGAHTIGTSNCTNINARLYNFNGTGQPDPTLNTTFANYVRGECSPNNITTRVPMKDQTGYPWSTNYTFDPYYYSNVLENKGFFGSDAALITNSTGLSIVQSYANDVTNTQTYVNIFNAAMVAMGQIQVTPGGRVRINCSAASYD